MDYNIFVSILQVEHILFSDTDHSIVISQNIIETVRILFAAGSSRNIAESNHSINSALVLLINSTYFVNPFHLVNYDCACAYQNQFQLRVKLIEMFEVWHVSYGKDYTTDSPRYCADTFKSVTNTRRGRRPVQRNYGYPRWYFLLFRGSRCGQGRWWITT